MEKQILKILLLGTFIITETLYGQLVINIDSIETTISLNREENDYGVTLFRKKIKHLNQNYEMIFVDDKNKKNTDSIDVVNINGPGGQSISANSYPFQNSSIVFSIDKNVCLYINKINPFDSSIIVQICKCPQKGVDDTLITDIPDIVVSDYFTSKKINLKQYILENKSKKIAVYFWWSACSPCIKELPLLKELKKRGYQVINFCASISDKEMVKKFVSKFSLKEPQFIGGNDVIGNTFNQSGFPQLILFEQKEKYPLYFGGIEAALEYLNDIKGK